MSNSAKETSQMELWKRARRGWLPTRLSTRETLWNGKELVPFPPEGHKWAPFSERHPPDVRAAIEKYYADREPREDLPIPTSCSVWRIFVLPCGHEVSFWMGHEGKCVPERIQCPYWIGHKRTKREGR